MASCGLHYTQDKYITLGTPAERRRTEMDGQIGDGGTEGQTEGQTEGPGSGPGFVLH